MITWIYALISVLLVSSVSLLALAIFWIGRSSLDRLSHLLVSFAVGALIGDAFIHLLPESFKKLDALPLATPLLTILGIGLFLAVEKYIHWRHCHQSDCHDQEHAHPVVVISLIGDAVHNFIDGLAIGAAFMSGPIIGIATSTAIIIHEIPQEIGDFAIYVHSGMSRLKALWLNLLSSLTAIIGTILALILGASIQNFSFYLLPLTAGGFIYLALSDLVPELHRHTQPKSSLSQILAIAMGVVIMTALTLLE